MTEAWLNRQVSCFSDLPEVVSGDLEVLWALGLPDSAGKSFLGSGLALVLAVGQNGMRNAAPCSRWGVWGVRVPLDCLVPTLLGSLAGQCCFET